MNTDTSTATPSSSSSSEQCESGWTLYLDHSTQLLSADHTINAAAKSRCNRREKIPCCDVHRESFYNHDDDDDDDDNDDDEEEEEDLSMVSDASSGPRHLDEEEAEDVFCYGGGRKRGASESRGNVNVKLGRRRFDGEDFALDDTASSHPMTNMIFPSKKNGGVHCVENQASPIKSLLDYSSQGFSTTHFRVMVERKRR